MLASPAKVSNEKANLCNMTDYGNLKILTSLTSLNHRNQHEYFISLGITSRDRFIKDLLEKMTRNVCKRNIYHYLFTKDRTTAFEEGTS